MGYHKSLKIVGHNNILEVIKVTFFYYCELLLLLNNISILTLNQFDFDKGLMTIQNFKFCILN